MLPLPEIAPQDLLFGIASAVLLLWTLLVVVRSRFFGDILAPPSLEDEENGLFAQITPRRPNRQLAFVGSVFLHLAAFALLPWVEKFAPGKLPFHVQPYDFVVVQFKTQPAALKLPPDLARLLPPPEPVDTPPPPQDAELSDEDDPGRGNRTPAPRPTPEPAGGAQQAPAPPTPPTPEPSLIERVEIAIPERVAPTREALASAAPQTGVDVAPQAGADLSWYFAAMDPPKIPNPGLIAPTESANPYPELTAPSGNLPEIIRGAQQGQAPSGRPALLELAGALEGAGTGLAGAGLSDEESAAIRALLGESYGDGTLLDLIASSRGAGLGEGPAAGDQFGQGIIGEYGDGFGEGWRGRGPVPRKLHGIIVISDESAMPEAAGVLKGNPIYTVYIEVPGFDRKWILQVCEAGQESGGLQVQDGVIRIVTHKKMDPPFAFRRVGPKIHYDELDPYSTPPRVVVYGKVDAEGLIGDLRIVSGLDPETDDRILANMRSWDFHPAYRDGEAVEVEALFGIPIR